MSRIDEIKLESKIKEMKRTAEVLVDIYNRRDGVYFVVAFLIDCNRLSPEDLLLQLKILEKTRGAIAKAQTG